MKNNIYKNSIWAKEIIEFQDNDGLWGTFHTLSAPTAKKKITTEQALRRLMYLGYDINDEPIRKTVDYMSDCLLGKKAMPTRREKSHNWDMFMELMLSTWIRKFTKDCNKANEIAEIWSSVIIDSFKTGEYLYQQYYTAYSKAFGENPYGGRHTNFANFYHVSLLPDFLDSSLEKNIFDYIIKYHKGLYYFTSVPLIKLPENFESAYTVRYLRAIELMSEYKNSKGNLQYVTDWLIENRLEDGCWDMGSKAKDKIWFPLSDNWKNRELRRKDCTYRIESLLSKI